MRHVQRFKKKGCFHKIRGIMTSSSSTSTSARRPPLCLVQGCRFSEFHLTSAHKCGRCAGFGHGVLECQQPHRLRRLHQMAAMGVQTVRTPCTVPGCPRPSTHESSSHHCVACGNRYESCTCNDNDANAGHDDGDTTDEELEEDDPIATSPSPVVLSDSDDNDEDVPSQASSCPERVDSVVCPICRTRNDGVRTDVLSCVYTGSACVACFCSNPLVVHPSCRHAVLCRDCVKKWALARNNS